MQVLSYRGNNCTLNINGQQLKVYQIHTISQLFVAAGSIDNILEIVYQNSTINDRVQENSLTEDHVDLVSY